jgi:hypothetical protein
MDISISFCFVHPGQRNKVPDLNNNPKKNVRLALGGTGVVFSTQSLPGKASQAQC